jgi:hypothetical protein
LDALHEVTGVTSDLVSELLGLDHSNVVDNSLIYMEVGGQPTKINLDRRVLRHDNTKER